MTTRVRVTNEAAAGTVEARTLRVDVLDHDGQPMETRDLLPGRTLTLFLHSGHRLSVGEAPDPDEADPA